MKTVGIICEYNPFHLGHAGHIEKTKAALGEDACIVCVMSGNYVQRGDFAIFGKHARAKMAVLSGADIVIELPTPYALLSAGGFAKAGVYLLDALGICEHLSFGSESGSIEELGSAARVIASEEAERLIRVGLDKGLPYATAQQKAADKLLGEHSHVFKTPNNTLGIEYIRALDELDSTMLPVTVKRTGGEHDSDTGYSASAVRKSLATGHIPTELLPEAAVRVCMEELASGRGPVLMRDMEQAILSRLRAIDDFSCVSGCTDGLEYRFLREVKTAPTVASVLEGVKSKRYAMSRIRRVLMCAVLGITNDDTIKTPPYLRILAMNKRGIGVLKTAKKTAKMPIITKPASVNKQGKQAAELFHLEAAATDFYVLAHKKEEHRTGGSEWRVSPIVVE